MLKKLLRLSCLILGLSAGTLHADTAANGTWLLGICSGLITNETPTPNNNYCAGFVQGVMLSWYTAESQVNPKGAAFWINQFGTVSAVSSAKMVVTYLGQHPESMSHSAISLIIAAINQSYPIPPAAGS
jgi:hypothetical protein